MVTAREFLELHSILTAIVESELACALPVPEEAKQTLTQGLSEQPVSESAMGWLALLDLAVNPHLLRKQLKQNGAQELTLEALLRFLVGKKVHSQTDRDKVDWLATFYFQVREERTKQPTGWPKPMVQEILKGFEFPAVTAEAKELLEEVSSLLDEIRYFATFAQLTDSRIIQRGRDLKNRFGEEFFHPDVLAAIVNYNLIFGKKFNALLQDTMQKVRAIASGTASHGSSEARAVMHDDYRSTGDAMQLITELGRRKEPPKAPPAESTMTWSTSLRTTPPQRSSESGSMLDQLEELGVNVQMETVTLRKRTEEITVRLKAHPNLTTLPGAFTSLPLADWELAAFRTGYPKSEQTFRAEFARAITRAVAIVSLIHDEMPAYQEKKGTEYLWKKHYDALLFLLQEGRGQKERLLRLSDTTAKKGLIDKAKQLQQTAQKLDTALVRVAAIFQD